MLLRNPFNTIGHFIKGVQLRDSLLLGLISGLIGTLVMDVSNLLSWKNKKSEMLYGHLAGSMLMRGFKTNRTKNFWLGQVLHLITGAWLGVPILEVFKKYGKDNHILKGGFMGLLSWGILYDFGQKMHWFYSRANLTKTHYAALWHNMLYGIVTAQLIVTFGDQQIFPDRDKEKRIQKENISIDQKNQNQERNVEDHQLEYRI